MEVYKAARIASDLGADYFRVGYYRTDEGFTAGDFAKTEELMQKSVSDFPHSSAEMIG